MRGAEFLELYRLLEAALEEKYSGQHRGYTSVVYAYINSAESAPVREKLDLCREIRNLMTHSADLGGEPVVEPSEPVLAALREVYDYVCRPPLALECATPASRIVSAKMGDRVLGLMRTMEKRGFSMVPVLENGLLREVFSTASVFAYTLRRPEAPIRPEMTLRELFAALPQGIFSARYDFAPRTLAAADARRMFESNRGRNQRLAAIFITNSGRRNDPLLGILTPWDLLGKDT